MREKFRKLVKTREFLIGMLIFGFLILIYPIISNMYYSIEQNKIQVNYDNLVNEMSDIDINSIRDEARRYNEGLFNMGSDFDVGNRYSYIEESIKSNTLPYFFLEDKVIGSVIVPKVDINIPIFSGTTDSVLEKGAGLMLTGSLPVGGASTHTIITGHRGLPSSRLFRDLGELKLKDLFVINVLGEKMAYEVDEINIISPSDFSHLNIERGKDYATLLTCHPYMINSERLLVRGHRVPYVEDTIKEMNKQKKENRAKLLFEKYKEYIYGVIIFTILITGVSIYDKRKKKYEE